MIKKALGIILILSLILTTIIASALATEVENTIFPTRDQLEKMDCDTLAVLYQPFLDVMHEVRERYGVDIKPIQCRDAMIDTITRLTPSTFLESLMELVEMLQRLDSHNALSQAIFESLEANQIDSYTAQELIRNLNRTCLQELITKSHMLDSGYDICQVLSTQPIEPFTDQYSADVWQVSRNHLNSDIDVGVRVRLTRWPGGGIYEHLISSIAHLGGRSGHTFYDETRNTVTLSSDRTVVSADVRGRYIATFSGGFASVGVSLRPTFGVWDRTYTRFQ